MRSELAADFWLILRSEPADAVEFGRDWGGLVEQFRQYGVIVLQSNASS